MASWHSEPAHHQHLISELYPETHTGFVYNFFFNDNKRRRAEKNGKKVVFMRATLLLPFE
jgi:hypothetical protein